MIARITHAVTGLPTLHISADCIDNSGSAARALDPYFVNDVRLNWSVTSLKGVKELALNLTVRNIFSELYESNGWTYSYIYQEQRQEMVGLYPQAPVNVLGGVTVRF